MHDFKNFKLFFEACQKVKAYIFGFYYYVGP
jgi:hypothetical protein